MENKINAAEKCIAAVEECDKELRYAKRNSDWREYLKAQLAKREEALIEALEELRPEFEIAKQEGRA
jgi:ribosome-interacting GTPase 1